MKKIHARRLLKLADFLAGLPKERFFYGSWVGADWKGKPDLSCGTTACALGWAAAMPAFRRLGLTLKGRRRIDGWKFPALADDRGEPDGQTLRAAEKVFGLDLTGFQRLFVPSFDDRHMPARQVATRIRKFVRGRSSR